MYPSSTLQVISANREKKSSFQKVVTSDSVSRLLTRAEPFLRYNRNRVDVTEYEFIDRQKGEYFRYFQFIIETGFAVKE